MNPKQASIHSFFPTLKKDGTTLELRRFFYLHWSNQYSPKMQAVWLHERPKDVNYIEEMKWNQVRKTHTFYLCGYFPDLKESRFDIPHEPKYKNIANLKSHLQKSIRKGNEQLALSSAIHIIKMNPIELLRRLPIIMIEDVILHESFPTLIWLMVAVSNGFRLKKYMYEWILGVIYVISKIETYDRIEYIDDIDKDRLIHQLESYNRLKNDSEISILYSMHIRIAYGGMECDMRMFQQYSHKWFQRFEMKTEKDIQMNQTKIRNILFTSVKWLELDDWDITAIDFHCAPKLIEFMQKRFPHIDENEMKRLIWENASSINYRIIKPVYQSELWNEIKSHLQRTQKYLLDSSF